MTYGCFSFFLRHIEASENEFGLSMMLAIKVFIVMKMIWCGINIARKLSLAWQVVALVLSAILPLFFPQIGNLVITRRAIKVRYCTFCKRHCDITNQVVDKRLSFIKVNHFQVRLKKTIFLQSLLSPCTINPHPLKAKVPATVNKSANFGPSTKNSS